MLKIRLKCLEQLRFHIRSGENANFVRAIAIDEEFKQTKQKLKYNHGL